MIDLKLIEYQLVHKYRMCTVLARTLSREVTGLSSFASVYRRFTERQAAVVTLSIDNETQLPSAPLNSFLNSAAPASHEAFPALMRDLALPATVAKLDTLRHCTATERPHYEPHSQYRSGVVFEKLGTHHWFPEYSFLITESGKLWRHAKLGNYVDPFCMSTFAAIAPDPHGISRYQPYWVKHSRRIAHNALIGTHYAATNYGHFLLDIAPLLPFAVQHDLPIVCKPLTAWQRRVFSAFGVKPERIIECRERVIELNQPIVSNRHNCQGTYSAHPALAETFARLLSTAGIAQAGMRRIFVSRAGHHNRNADRELINRSALEELMQARGFEVLRPENYSFLEQASLFAGAQVVVCEFGAGFANTVFCQPGTTVIEIIPQGMNDPWSVNLATALALNYVPVFQHVSPDDRETVEWGNRKLDNRRMRYAVDLELLQQVLDTV